MTFQRGALSAGKGSASSWGAGAQPRRGAGAEPRLGRLVSQVSGLYYPDTSLLIRVKVHVRVRVEKSELQIRKSGCESKSELRGAQQLGFGEHDVILQHDIHVEGGVADRQREYHVEI